MREGSPRQGRVLIIGGMGFVGLHTARKLLDAGHEVVITQHSQRREPEFLKDEIGTRVQIERLDVVNPHDVIHVARKHQVETIVNLVTPDADSATLAEEFQVHMFGLLNTLEAARTVGARRVVHASSLTVYQGVPSGPFREDMPLPIDPPGGATPAYKKAEESVALYFGDRSGLEVVIARLGGIYGPLYGTMNHAIARMCYAAAHDRPADFRGSRMGMPHAGEERMYGYVKDVAWGVQLLCTTEQLNHRIYNISSGVATTYREIADCVRRLVPIEIELPEGKGRDLRSNPYMDISRARQDLGFEPQYDIQRGVAEYIDWLRTHPE